MCFKALLGALYNYVYCSFEDKADVVQKMVLIFEIRRDVVHERLCKFTLS